MTPTTSPCNASLHHANLPGEVTVYHVNVVNRHTGANA